MGFFSKIQTKLKKEPSPKSKKVKVVDGKTDNDKEKSEVVVNEKLSEKKSSNVAESSLLGVLRRPIVTEKIVSQGESWVAFEVGEKTKKRQVLKAFVSLYNIEPVIIRLVRKADKQRKTRYGMSIKRGYKKAYIKLPPGATIDSSATPTAM